MNFKLLISLSFFCAFVSSLFAAKEYDMSTWRVYRTKIPRYYLEYSIPANLRKGYGPQPAEITSSDLTRTKDGTAFLFGKAAYQKSIATYFFGVAGDFNNFDMTFDIFVMKFDWSGGPIKSTEKLVDYVRQTLSEKWVLKGGESIDDLGSLSMVKIGSFDTVVATAADLYHVKEVTLNGGGITALQPYQWYFIRLDDELVIGLHINHFNQKRLTPKWHADANAMAISIIRNLKVTPQEIK